MRAALAAVPRPAWFASALLLAMAFVPVEFYAARFAHPLRVELMEGRIPEATVFGAQCFRATLAAAAALVPVLAWRLRAACVPVRRAERGVPATAAERRMLLAIVAGAAAIRIAFASESLWYDEISAFLSFAIEGPAVAFGSYTVPTNHVPMTLAMWAAFELTGSLSELALRAPAIAAGIATVPAAYALGATLLGRRAGLVMALSAAVAPIPVVESVEARGYAFVVLASTLAAFFLARGARTGAMRDFMGLALALAFAAWSHPVAILLAVSVGVVGLARDRRLAIAALLAGVIAAVLLSPLVGDILATRASYARVSGDQPAVFSREGLEALAGLTLSWSVVPANPWDAVLPNPLLAAVAAVGGIALARGGAPRLRRARAAALPFAMAFAGAFALTLAAGTWIYARFLLFAVPLSLLALALGARRMRFGVALIVAGSALSLPFLLTKQPIREAVAFVAAKRSAEDRVATIGLPDNAVGFYAEQYGFTARATGFLGDELRTVLEEDRPKFVIALYPDRIDPEILRLLDEGHDRTQRLEGWADWGAGAVEVWTASR